MELITGYKGQAHVTAAQTGATNAGIFGSGQFILNVSDLMEATKTDNNHVSIGDGYAINQGRYFCTTGESVTIETGTASNKREDLIVARYEKAASGVESVTLKVIKGTAGADYATPDYVTGDILAGDTVDEMPLYKVHLIGAELEEIVRVAEIKESFGGGIDLITNAEYEALSEEEQNARDYLITDLDAEPLDASVIEYKDDISVKSALDTLNNSLTNLKWNNKTSTYRPLTVSGLTFSDYDWTVFENDLEIIFRFYVTATATFSTWTKIVDFTIPMAFENYINVPKWNNTSDVGDCQVRIKSDGLYLRINKTGNYSPVITGCKA